MLFKQIKIQNFMPIGEVVLDLTDRGLILISGENLDETSASSNGAGKTSIISAMSWVLFGKTDKELTGDSVVHRYVKKDCLVELTVEDNEETYIVRRYRKHTVEKNRLTVHKVVNGSEIEITLGSDRLTQESVERIIGCSYEVFTAAVYAGQEKFPDLPGMTDKMLKVLIEEASGVEQLQRAYEIARNKFNLAKTQLEGVDIEATQVRQLVQHLEQEVRESEVAIGKWDRDREARFRNLEKAIWDKHEESETLLKTIDPSSLVKIEEGMKKIRDKLVSYNDLQTELAKRNLAVQRAEREIAIKDHQITAMSTRIAQTQEELSSIEQKVGTSCRECGKVYAHTDLDTAVMVKQGVLQSLVKDLETLRAERDDLLVSLQSVQDTLNAFQVTMPDVSQITLAQGRLEAHRGQIEEKQRQVSQLQRFCSEGKQTLEKIREEVNPIREMKVSLQDRLEAARQDLMRVDLDKRQEAEINLVLHKDALDVFSPAGVRAQILDTVTPFLNERTAEYLGQLSDGNITATWQTLTKNAKGELKEKFTIDVASTTGGDGFKALSGGEKRKVRLATAMALSDLVASRATKAIPLAVYDEVDSGLDETGLERLMDVLEAKARSKGTVLVISHNDISGYIRNTMTVCKKDGMAYLEQ